MKKLINDYKITFTKEYTFALISSFLVFFSSMFINYLAGNYATRSTSNYVTDLILSNTRVFDVTDVFVYGPIIFWVILIFFIVSKPKTAPFVIKSIALFIIIRSIFVTLTHIGPFPTKVLIDNDLLENFTFGGDLFFSGHTGAPFLMALVFWKNKKIRIFCLVSSVVFGITVLLGHIHYSIDVLSAFFITYSIFHLCEKFFKKERNLFFKGEI